MDEVIALINSGAYQDAINKLQNDLLKKTDGCAASGQPDKNDWITDCSSQSQVYQAIIYLIGYLQSKL